MVLPFRFFCLPSSPLVLFPLLFLFLLSSPCQPQLGNLLQVNRTLGRNVPLASQLILMPNGAVAAVQQEAPSAQSPGVHTDADQVSGNHLTCGWALGRAKGKALDQGPPFHAIAALPLFRILIFFFSSSISIDLEHLSPFSLSELGREADVMGNSSGDLGSLILRTQWISFPFF